MTAPAFLWLLLVWPAGTVPDAERTFADVFATEGQCQAGYAEVQGKQAQLLAHSCTQIPVGSAT